MGLFGSRPTGTVLPLCILGHPMLRRRAREVTKVTPEIRQLAEDMVATLRAHDGIGLAAPQVGRSLRLVALIIPPPRGDDEVPVHPLTPGEVALLPRMPLVIVNPVLSELSIGQEYPYSEGCLSVPGVTARVVRPEFLQLTARTLDDEELNCRCGGLLARCLQHEVDHLDGKLFIERAAEAELEQHQATLAKLRAHATHTMMPTANPEP